MRFLKKLVLASVAVALLGLPAQAAQVGPVSPAVSRLNLQIRAAQNDFAHHNLRTMHDHDESSTGLAVVGTAPAAPALPAVPAPPSQAEQDRKDQTDDIRRTLKRLETQLVAATAGLGPEEMPSAIRFADVLITLVQHQERLANTAQAERSRLTNENRLVQEFEVIMAELKTIGASGASANAPRVQTLLTNLQKLFKDAIVDDRKVDEEEKAENAKLPLTGTGNSQFETDDGDDIRQILLETDKLLTVALSSATGTSQIAAQKASDLVTHLIKQEKLLRNEISSARSRETNIDTLQVEVDDIIEKLREEAEENNGRGDGREVQNLLRELLEDVQAAIRTDRNIDQREEEQAKEINKPVAPAKPAAGTAAAGSAPAAPAPARPAAGTAAASAAPAPARPAPPAAGTAAAAPARPAPPAAGTAAAGTAPARPAPPAAGTAAAGTAAPAPARPAAPAAGTAAGTAGVVAKRGVELQFGEENVENIEP